MIGSINIDRFSGEAAEPPVWGHCDYCGADVYEGHTYSEHEGLAICAECAPRYALALFERDARPKTAVKEAKSDD